MTTTGEPQRLAPGIELAVYRIVQEALTNALKHGGNTTTASVSLHYGPTEVAITIADTGKGVVSSLTSTGSGNGLIGMKERVDAYHGDFSAGPKPGGGYEVRARIPLDDQFASATPDPQKPTAGTSTGVPTKRPISEVTGPVDRQSCIPGVSS